MRRAAFVEIRPQLGIMSITTNLFLSRGFATYTTAMFTTIWRPSRIQCCGGTRRFLNFVEVLARMPRPASICQILTSERVFGDILPPERADRVARSHHDDFLVFLGSTGLKMIRLAVAGYSPSASARTLVHRLFGDWIAAYGRRYRFAFHWADSSASGWVILSLPVLLDSP